MNEQDKDRDILEQEAERRRQGQRAADGRAAEERRLAGERQHTEENGQNERRREDEKRQEESRRDADRRHDNDRRHDERREQDAQFSREAHPQEAEHRAPIYQGGLSDDTKKAREMTERGATGAYVKIDIHSQQYYRGPEQAKGAEPERPKESPAMERYKAHAQELSGKVQEHIKAQSQTRGASHDLGRGR